MIRLFKKIWNDFTSNFTETDFMITHFWRKTFSFAILLLCAFIIYVKTIFASQACVGLLDGKCSIIVSWAFCLNIVINHSGAQSEYCEEEVQYADLYGL